MRYSLVYYNDKNVLEIKGYSHYSDSKIFNENKLKDIDDFTKLFATQDDLENYLIYNGLLPRDFVGEFGVALYGNTNELKKILPYGISFSRDAKFFNFDRLSNFYTSHLTDQEFMNEFFKYFYFLQKLPQFEYFFKNLENYFHHFLDTGLLPLETKTIMNNFLIQYTIEKKNNHSKRSYSKLRNLAMFVINYIKENNLRDKPLEINENDRENIKKTIDHYKYLLTEENLPEEVIEAYESVIKNMYHSLNDIDSARERKKGK